MECGQNLVILGKNAKNPFKQTNHRLASSPKRYPALGFASPNQNRDLGRSGDGLHRRRSLPQALNQNDGSLKKRRHQAVQPLATTKQRTTMGSMDAETLFVESEVVPSVSMFMPSVFDFC